MPNLPTISIVDQATWDRVFSAFNGDPAYYKAWLRSKLVEEVRRVESVKAAQQAQVDLEANIPIT